MRNLGGDLAYPPTLLVYTRIDTHEVGTGQVNRLAFGGNCPSDVKRTAADTIIRMAVCIAIIVCCLHPHIAFSALVHSIVWQASTIESKRRVGEPKREIVLRVESVLMHIPLLALVVVPQNIGGIGEGVLYVGLRRVSGRGAVVGKGVLVYGGRVGVFAARKFVEWVIGQAILVDIYTDHHNTWFATATLIA